MSRMSNMSNALRIVSRANGWDPDKIEGGGSIAPMYHMRETPTSSDTGPIPAEAASPEQERDSAVNATTAPRFTTPTRTEHGRTTNADPYDGMPGSTGGA